MKLLQFIGLMVFCFLFQSYNAYAAVQVNSVTPRIIKLESNKVVTLSLRGSGLNAIKGAALHRDKGARQAVSGLVGKFSGSATSGKLMLRFRGNAQSGNYYVHVTDGRKAIALLPVSVKVAAASVAKRPTMRRNPVLERKRPAVARKAIARAATRVTSVMPRTVQLTAGKSVSISLRGIGLNAIKGAALHRDKGARQSVSGLVGKFSGSATSGKLMLTFRGKARSGNYYVHVTDGRKAIALLPVSVKVAAASVAKRPTMRRNPILERKRPAVARKVIARAVTRVTSAMPRMVQLTAGHSVSISLRGSGLNAIKGAALNRDKGARQAVSGLVGKFSGSATSGKLMLTFRGKARSGNYYVHVTDGRKAIALLPVSVKVAAASVAKRPVQARNGLANVRKRVTPQKTALAQRKAANVRKNALALAQRKAADARKKRLISKPKVVAKRAKSASKPAVARHGANKKTVHKRVKIHQAPRHVNGHASSTVNSTSARSDRDRRGVERFDRGKDVKAEREKLAKDRKEQFSTTLRTSDGAQQTTDEDNMIAAGKNFISGVKPLIEKTGGGKFSNTKTPGGLPSNAPFAQSHSQSNSATSANIVDDMREDTKGQAGSSFIKMPDTDNQGGGTMADNAGIQASISQHVASLGAALVGIAATGVGAVALTAVGIATEVESTIIDVLEEKEAKRQKELDKISEKAKNDMDKTLKEKAARKVAEDAAKKKAAKDAAETKFWHDKAVAEAKKIEEENRKKNKVKTKYVDIDSASGPGGLSASELARLNATQNHTSRAGNQIHTVRTAIDGTVDGERGRKAQANHAGLSNPGGVGGGLVVGAGSTPAPRGDIDYGPDHVQSGASNGPRNAPMNVTSGHNNETVHISGARQGTGSSIRQLPVNYFMAGVASKLKSRMCRSNTRVRSCFNVNATQCNRYVSESARTCASHMGSGKVTVKEFSSRLKGSYQDCLISTLSKKLANKRKNSASCN